MRKQLIITLSLLALTACDQQTAEPVAAVEHESTATAETVALAGDSSHRPGKVLFALHCAGCHDPGPAHAATKQLALVRGEDMAVIMQRKDLTPAYIKFVVRDGLLEMPPFRPTDINDVELTNLATYIVDSAQAYQSEETK